MKHKKLPSWVPMQKLLGSMVNSKVGIIISYWVLQGMLYMDRKEAGIKILIDVGITVLLSLSGLSIPVAFFVAHSLNMLLNGHFYAMLGHMGVFELDPPRFVDYASKLQTRIRGCKWILGAVAFGSLSKGGLKKTSDLDLRFIPKPGLFSFIMSSLCAVRERFYAFIGKFPLDLYVVSFEKLNTKIDPGEQAVIFFEADNLVSSRYKQVIYAEQCLADVKRVYSIWQE